MGPTITAATTPSRRRRSSAETREHLLEVAHELFYWEGIRATGVDHVAQAAEVGPTTLYRLFASKDALVTAYVERAAAGYQDVITSVTAPSAGAPRDRILALFEATLEMVQPEHCRGCPFLMALAEYPDPTSSVHEAAVAVKTAVRARVHELTDEMGATQPLKDPSALADQLALVLEGVYASVQALTAAGPAMQARATAEVLIDAANA